jgi:16S rRNA (guanine527-N7)-methyltransferase
MADFKDILRETFKNKGFELTAQQEEQFEKYFNLLVEWNKKINLTTIVEDKDVAEKHFLDSILPSKLVEKDSAVIDIGCGAGFPSLPLKIVRPDIKLTLVDSVQKKLVFVDEVVRSLGLKNVNIVHSRAEDLAQKADFREKFKFCVSRAVAQLNTLCEYCLPFVKQGGQFLAYKSKNIDEEISNSSKAIKLLGGEVENVLSFDFKEMERKIVVIKKIGKTPKLYPRDKNKPRLSPIV